MIVALVLAMFADTLCSARPPILSTVGTDLSNEFVYWRQFGFEQLKHGNLALWNPHSFCGAPFFGGFQSALVYPPNWLYVVLPLGLAINLGIALHVTLAGLFMYLWTRRRGLHPGACLLASVVLMFCGAHFTHIYAGHLCNLCAMPWVPLLLAAVDGVFLKRSVGWCLVGISSVTMLILAGHPQYVFYTAIAVAVYSGLGLIRATQRGRIVLGLMAIACGGLALSAVQILPGLDASWESVRSGGVPYEFAAMFSFPPENILTLLSPTFFGYGLDSQEGWLRPICYWGRCYQWEMSLYVGISGLVLAGYAATSPRRDLRRYSLIMVLVLLVLALGSHTPLFRLLYNAVPGFDRFRSNSKFIFQASVFLAMLAGVGMHDLIESRRVRCYTVGVVAATAGLVLIAAALIGSAGASTPAGWWLRTMQAIHATRETYLPPSALTNAAFVRQAALVAAGSLALAGITLAALAGLLWLVQRWRGAVWCIALLGMLEVSLYARLLRPTFDLARTRQPELEELIAAHPGDYRVLNLVNPNLALTLRVGDVWGDDPGVPKRYAEFMSMTQDLDPSGATQYLPFRGVPLLFKILRCRYVFDLDEYGRGRWREMSQPMRHLELFGSYVLAGSRNEVFQCLRSPEFDYRKQVILERAPDPLPDSAAVAGIARIVGESTDHLVIEADVPAPVLLVITDGYSADWHAVSLPGSAQDHYDVLPADYVLRAIPLVAGRHRLQLEYAPRSYQRGLWITLLALSIYLGTAIWYVGFKRRNVPRDHSSTGAGAKV